MSDDEKFQEIVGGLAEEPEELTPEEKRAIIYSGAIETVVLCITLIAVLAIMAWVITTVAKTLGN